jgi:TolB-like protein/tRNA A-37 threonylcarbamoyl transferase component Bud32
MSLVPGSFLGGYEILTPLGAGGMGEVYRARDPKLRRHVAIKILPAAFATDPDRVARFEREAHAVAALSHPNILAIHDFGTDRGIMYAVTELLDGQTLRDAISAGPMPRWKAIDCATQIAKGLEAAHARGVVHRDLKPENVFVSASGHIKILDFGLAASRAPARSEAAEAETATVGGATAPGAVMGTAGYMSPEQVRGETVDHRSDIFSFGCVVYEMLSGKRAFQGPSSVDTLHATLHSEPRDLSTLTGVHDTLVRIVGRCLEKAPEARFQTASDLVFALGAVTATPPASPRALSRYVAAVIAVVLLSAVAGWRLTRSSSTDSAASLPAAAALAPRGIAVLPFENLGGPDHEYFAAGVTEEVTLQIAKISALRVMSRAAVARFKGGAAELPAMTRELRIGAVLTGSVRHADNRVRVGVQLLEAPSGETIWSEQYDGDVRNVLDVQSTVALGVARSLQAALAPEERARIERPPTGNAEAYELYLKSRPLSNFNAAQNRQALALLQKAVSLDAKFALAHTAIARRYYWVGTVTGRADFERSLEAARLALSLDPQLARAHHALAVALIALGRLDEARLAMQRAIELDGNFTSAILDLSLLENNAGRLDQSVYWALRGVPLAPNLASSYYHLAIPLLVLDDAAAARVLAAAEKKFPVSDPGGGVRLQMMQAIIEMRQGRADAALARLRATTAAQPTDTEAEQMLTEVAVFGGDADAAVHLDKMLQGGATARALWTPYTPRTMRAFLFLQSGARERAQPLIDAALAFNRDAIASGDRSYGPPLENAALAVLRGERVTALDELERAERAGWRDGVIMRRDPLLAPLAGDVRFAQTVQRIERDVREMRGRIDLHEIDSVVSRLTGAAAAGRPNRTTAGF